MAKEMDREDTPLPAPEENGGEPKKSGSITKIGMIAAVLLVQIVASYFLQKTFFFQPATAGSVRTEAKKPEKPIESEEMKVVMLDEIVVNPAETGGRRYLVVTLGLQTAAPEAEKIIEKYKPLIRDAMISLLSSKHLDELSRISYRDTLRTEIKDAANRQLRGLSIENIVFSSYVLQ